MERASKFFLRDNRILLEQMPSLRATDYVLWSPRTRRFEYNCVGFVLSEETRRNWWEAGPDSWMRWPRNVSRESTVAAYRHLFLVRGFQSCANARLERGWEKIALFGESDAPDLFSHVALQRPDGTWVSKLGTLHDIEHTLEGIEGPEGCGAIVGYMRRRRRRRSR